MSLVESYDQFARGRFLRGSVMLSIAAALVLLTAYRDHQVSRQLQPGDLVRAWQDKVQMVPPMRIEQVDPASPVLVSGVLRRDRPASDLDDPELGVNFGSCVFGTRDCWVRSIDPVTGEEKTVSSALRESADFANGRETNLVPPGGVSLQGARVDDATLRAMAYWVGKFNSPYLLPPPSNELTLIPPTLSRTPKSRLRTLHPAASLVWTPDGGPRKFERKRDFHLKTYLKVRTDISSEYQYSFSFTWTQPHRIYFFGGVRDGALVPFEGILAVDRLTFEGTARAAVKQPLKPIYHFSDKPLDAREVLAMAEAQQLVKNSDKAVARSIPYSRVMVGGVLMALSILCLMLAYAPKAKSHGTGEAGF